MSLRRSFGWRYLSKGLLECLFTFVVTTKLAGGTRYRSLATNRIGMVQTFGCPPADREGVLAAYRRRIAEVSAAIPPERLLVFDVAEGWTPLCRFLDVPVP
jgi:Sulfotransferase domain